MVIPEKVRILYKDYTVVQEQNVHNGHDDLYGQIDYGSQIIRLDGQYSAEQKKATLIHEIVHGLDDMYQIGLSEKKVSKLGVAFYQVIKDNPELFGEAGEESMENET